jgi:hypothetical protein
VIAETGLGSGRASQEAKAQGEGGEGGFHGDLCVGLSC